MKKRLWMTMAAALILALVFCGCGPAAAPEEENGQDDKGIKAEGMTAEAEDLLEEALEHVDELETPVREYGESYGFNKLERYIITDNG